MWCSFASLGQRRTRAELHLASVATGTAESIFSAKYHFQRREIANGELEIANGEL
jgi:hypothetical protein